MYANTGIATDSAQSEPCQSVGPAHRTPVSPPVRRPPAADGECSARFVIAASAGVTPPASVRERLRQFVQNRLLPGGNPRGEAEEAARRLRDAARALQRRRADVVPFLRR